MERRKHKDRVLSVNFNEDDFDLISKAASVQSLQWASFIRNSAVVRAREILKGVADES